MKQFFLLGLFCICLVNCSKDSKASQSASQQKLAEQIDQYLIALTSLEKFNGVIAVYENGQELLNKAYNLKEDPEHTLYVNKEDQFDIHSASKIMSNFLLYKMEESKIISFDHLLNQYYPDFPRGDEISLAMLRDHKSGLPRELSNFDGKAIELDPQQVLDLIKNEILIFEPGTDIQYSNLGFKLLYGIIAKVNQGSFEEQLNEFIFKPNDMSNSGAHYYLYKDNLKNLVSNHILVEGRIVQVDNVLEDEFKQARIYSTAQDLSSMLIGFSKDTLANKLAKEGIIGHSGGSDGARAHIHLDLKSGRQFVLLSNYEGMPFQKTISDLRKILENKSVNIPKEINRKASEIEESTLSQYHGIYEFRDLDTKIAVAIENGRLTLYQDGDKIASMFAENDSTFFEKPDDEELFEFRRNEDGSFDALMGFKGVKLPGKKID